MLRGGDDPGPRPPPTACPSHRVPALHEDQASWKRRLRRAPARVQWGPERDPHHTPLSHRSLQLCLAGEAAARYADEWMVGIEDVTAPATEVGDLVGGGEPECAAGRLREGRP